MLKGDTAEEILAVLSSEDTAHRGPLTLEGGVARVMKKLLDQERPMLICSEMRGAHNALISCISFSNGMFWRYCRNFSW